jgi:Co/Zn/Cd efflux system component
MKETTFLVPKMDCPSEERLIRMAIEPSAEVSGLRFDLDARSVVVTHSGEADAILDRLTPLGLGARIEGTKEKEGSASADGEAQADPAGERRVLKLLLAINAVMFVAELGLGFLAQSTGLVSDSLDMLADAMVYGLSLLAVGRATKDQVKAARVSGVLQGLLAFGALAEVARRAVHGSEPVEGLMIGVALVALAANLTCVALLARHRKGGVHLRASWIFSTNDALANLGVVAAGILVAVTGSAIPDLVIGTIVGLLVLTGAVRILRLR